MSSNAVGCKTPKKKGGGGGQKSPQGRFYDRLMRMKFFIPLEDTSVVVRHFRDGEALLSKLPDYRELYLSHVVVAELYAGAFRSSCPEKHLQQITQSLDAVDVPLPDGSHSENLWTYFRTIGAGGYTHSSE